MQILTFRIIPLILLLLLDGVFPFNHSSTIHPRDTSISHRYYKWWNGCHKKVSAIVTAYIEVGDILRKTDAKLKLIKELLAKQPGENDKITPEERTALLTFEVIFGQAYFGKEHKKENAVGEAHVNHVHKIVTGLLDAHTSTSKKVTEDIWCDESLFNTTYPSGDPLPPPPKGISYYYFDTRPAERGGQELMPMTFKCDDGTVLAYTWSIPDAPIGPVDAIVFCPQHLDRWSTTLLRYSKPYSKSTLEQVLYSHLSPILLHELSHSKSVLGLAGGTMDSKLKDGTVAYTWAAVTDLAVEEPLLAVRNAQSIAFFALAMYLDEKAWDMGIPDDHLPEIVGWVLDDAYDDSSDDDSSDDDDEGGVPLPGAHDNKLHGEQSF